MGQVSLKLAVLAPSTIRFGTRRSEPHDSPRQRLALKVADCRVVTRKELYAFRLHLIPGWVADHSIEAGPLAPMNTVTIGIWLEKALWESKFPAKGAQFLA